LSNLHRAQKFTRGGDFALATFGLGLGATIALFLLSLSRAEITNAHQLYPAMILISRLFALTGSYLLLAVIFLASRAPVIERSIGQDGMIAWHKKLGPTSLLAIAAHPLLLLLGQAGLTHKSLAHSLRALLVQKPATIGATLALLLLLLIGISSHKSNRAAASYPSWWSVHLLGYLALGLALPHQLLYGQAFAHHIAAEIFWIGLFLISFGSVAIWRITLPIKQSLQHRLRLTAIVSESHDVMTLVFTGKNLHRLRAHGGQYLNFRFKVKGHRFRNRTLALSAVPTESELRVTVKADQLSPLRTIPLGTVTAIEGPYGIFTAERSTKGLGQALLVGAGVGIAPLYGLLEQLDDSIEVDLIYRESLESDMIMKSAFEDLAHARGARIHYLLGERKHHFMSPKNLTKYAPNLRDCDVYVCGPAGLMHDVRESARLCGVPSERIHLLSFDF
jgi:predicted ferric reductase